MPSNLVRFYPARAGLRREEGLQQTGERGQIARLNPDFARPCEFAHYAFAARETTEQSCRRFAQRVMQGSFPRHKMSCVNYVSLARSETLAMDSAI